MGEIAILVDIGNDIQLAPLAANVTDLKDSRITKALFDLEIVVIEVGCTEILADGISAQALRITGACAIRIRTRRTWTEDRCATELRLPRTIEAPVVNAPADSGNTVRTECIALDPLRGVDGRTKIQERIQVDLIIEHADAPSDDKVGFASG